MNSVAPSRRLSACSLPRQLRPAAAPAAPRRGSSAPPAAAGRSAAPAAAAAPASCSPPVGELALQHLALQPVALPDREVRVLDRQLRQRRGPPCARTPRRAPPSSRTRMPIDQPSVTMWCIVSSDDVVLRRQPQQRAAQQRTAREVERAAGLFAGQARGPAPRAGSPAAPTGRPRAARTAPAGWITCTGSPSPRGEDRAQRLVAAHDLAEAARQRPRASSGPSRRSATGML